VLTLRLRVRQGYPPAPVPVGLGTREALHAGSEGLQRYPADALWPHPPARAGAGRADRERGQRFHGLTPEGERVLKWAHAILDNWSSLQQEIAKLRNVKGTLIGRLSLGVIPSGLPMAALIAKTVQERHPGVELTVLSQSSIEILRNLEDFSIDGGRSYLDNEPIEGGARPVSRMRRPFMSPPPARSRCGGRACRRSGRR
jgi:DNA-binding transcriptional LysR family regulator